MLPLQNVSTTKILATTRPNLSSFCRIITGQMSSVGCMGQTGGAQVLLAPCRDFHVVRLKLTWVRGESGYGGALDNFTRGATSQNLPTDARHRA